MSHDRLDTPSPRPPRRALDRLAVSALAVEGVDHAAVGSVRAGSVLALGATDLAALALSEEQVRTGAGPVPDALVTRQPVAMAEMSVGWRARSLADLAGAHGVVSLAAYPVVADGRVVGVVACFGTRRGVPGPGISDVVARAAGVLAPRPVGGVERSTVALAAEVVGRRRRVSELEALVLLRRYARASGVTLEDVAESVLAGSPALDLTMG